MESPADRLARAVLAGRKALRDGAILREEDATELYRDALRAITGTVEHVLLGVKPSSLRSSSSPGSEDSTGA